MHLFAFSPFCTEGNSFRGFLFDAQVGVVHLDLNLLLLKRICFKRSKFRPLRVGPSWRGWKIFSGRVASMEGVLVHFSKRLAYTGAAVGANVLGRF